MNLPKPDATPALAPTPEEKPKPAVRRLEWPTLWHQKQIPFPWGSATRLRKSAKAAGDLDRPPDLKEPMP